VVACAAMESASTGARIVASGGLEVAGIVIGVHRCGDYPRCHGGRSVSAQGSGQGHRVIGSVSSGRRQWV